jgi:hypothetical protein
VEDDNVAHALGRNQLGGLVQAATTTPQKCCLNSSAAWAFIQPRGGILD